MKSYTLSLVAALSLALVGCGSAPPKQQVADCAFPDDGLTAAPAWVCGAPYKDLKIAAVGSYEKTGAGIDFQRTMAEASARDVLARQIRVTVQNMVKRYAETTGTGDAETVDRVNSSVSKQITNEELAGSKVYIQAVNAKTKTLFVLVGLDAQLAQDLAKHAVQTSMNKERALWQKLQAKKSFDEMAQEISKMQAQ